MISNCYFAGQSIVIPFLILNKVEVKFSFINRYINDWNSLPNSVMSAFSLNSFKIYYLIISVNSHILFLSDFGFYYYSISK